jgi:hypothetical protein
MWNHSFRMHQAFERRGLEWRRSPLPISPIFWRISARFPIHGTLWSVFEHLREGGARLFLKKAALTGVGDLALDRRLRT